MRHSRFLLLLVIAVVAAGCGSGVTGTAQLATILSSYLDPTGDAAAASGTVYDVLQVVTQRVDNSPFGTYDTLRTQVTFSGAPTLPAAGSFPSAAAELAFRLYFDTDQSLGTGTWQNGLCGNTSGGVDYIVDGTTAADAPPSTTTGRQVNGNYQVIDTLNAVSGEATVSVSGNVLTVNVPLTAIGGDDGQTNMSVRVGNGTDATTDCGPHTGGAVITREGAAKDRR